MLSKLVPVLLVLAYGAIWIGAALVFGYAGFIAVAIASMVMTSIAIVVATAG